MDGEAAIQSSSSIRTKLIKLKRKVVGEVKRKKEDYKHELFMLKVEYLQQTDLHKYQVETRLLTQADM